MWCRRCRRWYWSEVVAGVDGDEFVELGSVVVRVFAGTGRRTGYEVWTQCALAQCAEATSCDHGETLVDLGRWALRTWRAGDGREVRVYEKAKGAGVT
jgi:hypothetical protein